MTTDTTLPSIDDIRERLKLVEDPEIRLDIMSLGLIYDIEVATDGLVTITMTLTSPGCPLGGIIQGQVWQALRDLPGVKDVDVQITFNPPWDPRTMASDEVKMMLGIW